MARETLRATWLAAALTVISLVAGPAGAGTTPVGSAFSYQGRLSQSGTPFSGDADFEFSLWETAGGASQVGSMLPINGVPVASGVFSASLNFGTLAFDGNERWLQIAVRVPPAAVFTTLAPRQRIDAAPYALHALSALISGNQPNAAAFTNPANTYAGSSMSLDGGTLHVDSANNRVGIGTTAPAVGSALDVRGGDIRITPVAAYGGFHLMQGANIAGFLGLEGNNVVLSNNIGGGSLIFSAFPSSYIVADRMRIWPSGRIRMGPANLAPESTAWVHIIEQAAGVTMNPNSTLALERQVNNYLSILAPDNRETGVLFGKPTGGAESAAIVHNHPATPNGLQFRTNGNLTRMTIANNGNVGLGLNNTGPTARLDAYNEGDTALNNTAVFRTATPGSNISHIHHGAGGDWYIRSAINTGRVIIQDSPGNVGIGISTPSHKLTIDSPNESALRLMGHGAFDTLAKLQFQDPGYAHIHNDIDGGLTLHAAGRHALTGGNVGIGTTGPGTKLHIVNDNSGMNSLQSVNNAAAGTDVASGVVGITTQSNVNAAGVRGHNSHNLGTGVIGTGNNIPASTFVFGSGGAFTGWSFGVFANSVQTGSSGAGLLAQQNGSQVNVAYWNGFTFFKINGTGVVSTIVRDVDDKPVTMFAPESPECLLQDFGEGMLINGFAHIDLDPTFAKNVLIDPSHPLRVFIQLEGDENCQGVVVKNKTATGFDVMELRGGRSNTPFQYQISCNRADETLPGGRVSHYADLRFSPAPEPFPTETGAADSKVGQLIDQPRVRP